MEERRFDNLTRVLGAATSRRQVLKGLLGGLAASLIGSSALPVNAFADSGESCNRQSCFDEIKRQFQICAGSGHQYRNQINYCVKLMLKQSIQCNRTGCFDIDPGVSGQTVCCDNKCADLRDDLNNCGACGHPCPSEEQCVNGKCVCGGTTCGPCEICLDGECSSVCGSDGVCCQGACIPLCPGGVAPDPTTCTCNLCANVTCGTCQTCDSSTGHCVNASANSDCGNGNVCCNGQCLPACPQDQIYNPSTCQCEVLGGGVCGACEIGTANGCVPDSSTDGQPCGGCGICSDGTCVADVNSSCASCHECQPNGICTQSPDNTTCGDTEICCQGICITGISCGPCLPGEYQCPADLNGNQACCADGLDCCASDAGSTTCGPTNGVCCPVGTTFQCDSECCNVGETCSSTTNGTGHCCPAGSYVVDDGTCCSEAQICFDTSNGKVCCPSGQACSTTDNGVGYCCPVGSTATDDGTCCPNETQRYCGQPGNTICCPDGQICLNDQTGFVSDCCPTGSGAVTPDGTCCTGTQSALQCADGSWVCCDGDSTACCDAKGGVCPGQQSCFLDCCDATSEVCLDAAGGDDHPYCCPVGSSGVLPDGTCCTSTQNATPCTDVQWVCCDQNSTSCCN